MLRRGTPDSWLIQLTFCCVLIGVLTAGDLRHLAFQLFHIVLELFCEEDELSLISDIKDVVIGLVRLVQLVQTCHFAHELLRSAKMLLLCFVFQQARLIFV